MNILNVTPVPIPIYVNNGGSGSHSCGGHYEKWAQVKDSSWRCIPLTWEEMDEYLTWRWWTYKVYLPVGIIGGLIGLILVFCIIGLIWKWISDNY